MLAAILPPQAPGPHRAQTSDRDVIYSLRLDHAGDARPAGATLVTAVPFAPGVVADLNDVGFDVPGEAEVVERHGDGSVRWARFYFSPNWRALKGVTVTLKRGGIRPPLPKVDWIEPPAFDLVITDPDGIERRAAVGQWTVVEDRGLRQVLRADGAHARYREREATADVFYQYSVFVERFPGAKFFFVTVVLRNDPQSDAPGPARFQSYRIESHDPKVQIAAAWSRENGCTSVDGGSLWLLPKGSKDLWLGDGQTKMWRLVVDGSGDAARLRSLVRLRESPILPGLFPKEIAMTRAFGDLGDMVLGPPPASAAKLALEFADTTKRTREFGWNGPWGDVRDTHQTGSPRNGLSSDGVLRSLQTGHREWFDATWQKISQHALRPILRGVRAADHPDSLLFEGMPHPKFRDRIGREKDYLPRFSSFREGTSGGYRQETHGWNGFDHEHFTVDDLYYCYLLTGDPWIRFELDGIGQALLTYEFAKKPETTKSSRGDGWVLRGLCQLYKSLGDAAYLAAAKNLVAGMEACRGKGAMKWLHENDPDPRQLSNHPFEMPWQVAIAVDGLALYHDLTRDPAASRMIEDLADFLVKDGWNAADGVFRKSVATDGSGAFVNETERAGTQSWIASALVVAHRLHKKPEYMILADGLYREVRATNATFEHGGIQWTWWQSYLRDAYDRDALPGAPGK
jgi:hypothetical protein